MISNDVVDVIVGAISKDTGGKTTGATGVTNSSGGEDYGPHEPNGHGAFARTPR
jgi:hypothetical protein